ncbi:hypothetical protein CE658_24890 [Salmonella enterica]|nr:hypothetical protein [Salmonella enterica]EBT4079625.1 hypothetical protein [Salmonella enterica]EGE4753665.1 hypothetical protein [Salmonella enterica subsp. diarizonae serovar 38:[k]:z35]
MSWLTDEEILEVLNKHGRCMTCVVTYWLRDKHYPLLTSYVLRRLKKLEATGAVKRVKSSYAVQICREVVQ